MNRYFLPVGLTLAFLIAWFIPRPGATLQAMDLIPWMVVIIFLVNGYQTRLHQLPRSRGILLTLAGAIVINLFISPFLALAIVYFLAPPTGVAIGLLVMATVPTTLSSGVVLSRIAGGDSVKALFFTIVLNLIGVFTVPFMLDLTLESAAIISLSPWSLLRQLLWLVPIPFAIGMLLRPVLGVPTDHVLLRYLPSSCVIATVWMSLSSSVDTLRDLNLALMLMIICSAVLIHGSLLLLCWLTKFVYRVERGEWLALLFTASQKTLPVAIGVLTALGQSLGTAMVVCILFHFLQLFVDSLIASRIAANS